MPLPLITHIYMDGMPSWMPDPWRIAQAAGCLGSLALTKYLFGGTANASERSMHGRVVMITGGTSGVGAVVAYELAKRGANLVLLTAQPPSDPFVIDYVNELRERAGHPLIYAEQVDLASLHSVRTFATRWIDTLPPRRLDMVILCAAVEAVPAGKSREKRGGSKGGKAGRARREGGRTDGGRREARGIITQEGIERAWMVNYLANFHLLGLLSPALRSQPFDRDVRVIITTCSSYIGALPLVKLGDADDANEANDANETKKKKGRSANATAEAIAATSATSAPLPDWTPKRAYARSKLALMVFARSFQKHVDAYKRPDGLPSNVRVLLVDPGLSRTPGLRRWLSGGSLLALLVGYVLLFPLWWLFVQSADMGAQSVLFAAMEAQLRRMRDLGEGSGMGSLGGSLDADGVPKAGEPLTTGYEKDPLADKLVKGCRLVDVARRDVGDEAVGRALWEDSDRLVEETEKRAATMRQEIQRLEKEAEKEAEQAKKEAEQAQKDAAQKEEIAALVNAIKKGKDKEKKDKDKKEKKDKKSGKA